MEKFNKEEKEILKEISKAIKEGIITKENYEKYFKSPIVTKQEYQDFKKGENHMKDLMIFENEKFGKIRSIKVDNEVWFVAVDVCKILELTNPTMAINRLDEDERTKLNLGRQGNTNLVNEYGLYNLALASRKKEAKAFKRWITHEVLPQINETGSYNNSTNKLFAKLTECQIETSHNLVGLKRQLDETSNIILEHDKLLKERVYISPKEARDIQKSVYERAKIIAIDNDLPYYKVKKALFKRLYTTVNDTFEVATYRELPSYKFMDILDYISKTNVYTADLQCECGQISL